MLTTVYLDGALGEKFGTRWELDVSSPAEALRMIEANSHGFISWIRNNMDVYKHYRVMYETETSTRGLTEDELTLHGKPKSIRFVPVIAGSSGRGMGNIVTAVIIAAVAYVTGPLGFISAGTQSAMYAAAIASAVGGVVQMLTPLADSSAMDKKDNENKTSYYFNGGVNTTGQGVPVPLIYGRVRAGSHNISASLSIDQLLG